MRKICVLGLGYVGLPTAAMFATHGHEVVGVDVSPNVVRVLASGQIHIEEPGLRTLVQAALRSGNLVVREQPEEADAYIIAVPTPLARASQDNGAATAIPHADLSCVVSAAESIVPYLRPGRLVILESTSPPGTTVNVLSPIMERSGLTVGRDIYVAYTPERVLPGKVLEELVSNDRVIGGIDTESAAIARMLYATFVEGEILLTDASTAELVKLMENTYRDVNIALANEFALVSEQVGTNVWEAIEMANRHPRVHILRPGPGVGGHCIAVDPWFVAQAAPEATRLIQTARHINDAMPAHVVELVKEAVAGIADPVIACLGLTYKGDVDDIRESPAMEVLRLLQHEGLRSRSYDPHVRPGTVSGQVATVEAALANADAVALLTDHREFRDLPPATLERLAALPVIDTRNVLTSRAAVRRTRQARRIGERSGQELIDGPAATRSVTAHP